MRVRIPGCATGMRVGGHVSRAAVLRSRSAGLFVLLAVAMVLPLGAVDAKARTAHDRTADKAKPSPGPILAVVSLAKQRIWVYGNAGLIAQSAVSTGAAGYRT